MACDVLKLFYDDVKCIEANFFKVYHGKGHLYHIFSRKFIVILRIRCVLVIMRTFQVDFVCFVHVNIPAISTIIYSLSS